MVRVVREGNQGVCVSSETCYVHGHYCTSRRCEVVKLRMNVHVHYEVARERVMCRRLRVCGRDRQFTDMDMSRVVSMPAQAICRPWGNYNENRKNTDKVNSISATSV